MSIRAAFLLLLPGLACADEVACHVTYGGAEQVLVAPSVASPYTVPAVDIGSYFQFRIVFERARSSIKIYTYADNAEGSIPLHQATYAYPPKAQGGHGFTGLNFVYEPVRDGELQYWCELR
jgi:hypothetical protein